MTKRVAALGLSKRTKDDVRNTLLSWCADVCDAINESTRGHLAIERMAEATPTRNEEMQAWLRSEWSTREALVEMCWRLQFHPTLVSAVTSLYDYAEPPSESRRPSIAKAN